MRIELVATIFVVFVVALLLALTTYRIGLIEGERKASSRFHSPVTKPFEELSC